MGGTPKGAGKRTCLLARFSRERPDIQLLQETGTAPAEALKAPGYTGFHSKFDRGVPGSHGVSTYVHDRHIARTFVEAGHWDMSVYVETGGWYRCCRAKRLLPEQGER